MKGGNVTGRVPGVVCKQFVWSRVASTTEKKDGIHARGQLNGFCRVELAGSHTDSLPKDNPNIRVPAAECRAMVE